MIARYPQVFLLVALLLTGCASLLPNPGPKLFVGYWSIGAPFSDFSTSDGKHAFYIFGDDMPTAAQSFLEVQPEHRDATSESGRAQTAYFEVLGQPYTDKDVYKRLRVQKVLRMRPADPSLFDREGRRIGP